MKLTRTILFVLLSLSLLLAACGGGAAEPPAADPDSGAAVEEAVDQGLRHSQRDHDQFRPGY